MGRIADDVQKLEQAYIDSMATSIKHQERSTKLEQLCIDLWDWAGEKKQEDGVHLGLFVRMCELGLLEGCEDSLSDYENEDENVIVRKETQHWEVP